MESQISTGMHEGPGINIPQQGLHLILNGETGMWHGVLDTSMGPVATDMDTVPAGERVGTHEFILGVPEQFVALSIRGDEMHGTIVTEGADIPFRGRRHH